MTQLPLGLGLGDGRECQALVVAAGGLRRVRPIVQAKPREGSRVAQQRRGDEFTASDRLRQLRDQTLRQRRQQLPPFRRLRYALRPSLQGFAQAFVRRKENPAEAG